MKSILNDKPIRSSYIKNNFGGILRALILAYRPCFVVECGVLDGYSTFHIAHALRFNHSIGYHSKFIAYDLWDRYEYKHGDFQSVATMLRKAMLLNDFVNIHHGDAFKVQNNFKDETVDFLHMDISNDGEVLEKTIELWGPKMTRGGIIAFEGGSVERDNVEWMKEYDKKPIAPLITNYHGKGWRAQIFSAFPSMTLFFKR